MKKYILSFVSILIFGTSLFSQNEYYKDYRFSEADTLRGMLRAERTCYDVTYYDLNVKIDIDKKFISGYNEIHFQAVENFQKLQIDLFKNLKIKKIEFEGKSLSFERVHNAVFVDFPLQKKGVTRSFRVYYEGNPTVARNPPWDGGFVFSKDPQDNDWVAVSCEGIGASLWFPNKDHLSDEPDSVGIHFEVPNGLTCISNGNLRSTQQGEDGFTQYNWFVSYPINNYNITFNIGKYAHFSDTYTSSDGSDLAIDYYVLPDNLEKAKKHFQQVKPMLACFENLYGKYPFWEDGYALVETPYLGMEHQSAIAYGNQYMRGYLGGMMPEGIDFDYIIIHETGHEYWGNSVSCEDHAEMWIHESFCTYSEAQYVECLQGYEEGVRYLNYQKKFINNIQPILGPLDVNFDNWRAGDHYFKGAWVLHTLRHAIHNEELWFQLVKAIHEEHKISTVTTTSLVKFINDFTKKDFTKFFDQYLRHPNVPTLLYRTKMVGNDLEIAVKWESDVVGFDMPILVGKKGNYQQIHPTTSKVKKFTLKNISQKDFEIAEELFLINTKKI